ncbi:1858_t:CDS:2, partial [Paraglomus occultum]
MTAELPSRPFFASDDVLPPFNPPEDLHPALAAMEIKDWTYRGFMRQIIILNIPVESIQSVQRLWLEELNNLCLRKEIHLAYRAFARRLIDFQPFEQLKETETILNRYIRLRLQSQVSDAFKAIQERTELQTRDTLASGLVTNILEKLLMTLVFSSWRAIDLVSESGSPIPTLENDGLSDPEDFVSDQEVKATQKCFLQRNNVCNERDPHRLKHINMSFLTIQCIIKLEVNDQSNENVCQIVDEQFSVDMHIQHQLQQRALETASTTATVATPPITQPRNESSQSVDTSGDSDDRDEVITIEINAIEEQLRRQPLCEPLDLNSNICKPCEIIQGVSKIHDIIQSELKKRRDNASESGQSASFRKQLDDLNVAAASLRELRHEIVIVLQKSGYKNNPHSYSQSEMYCENAIFRS